MQLGFQLVLVVGLEPQGVSLASLDVVAGLIGVALEVVLVDRVGRQVDPGEHVVPGAVEHHRIAVGITADLVITLTTRHIRGVAAARVVAGAAIVGLVFQAAAAQVLGGQFEHAEQRVEAQARAEVVDAAQRGVEGLDALGVVDLAVEVDHLPADIDELPARRRAGTIGQVADQVVGGGDTNRQVRPVGQLAKHRGLAQGGVEAEAVHADIFSVAAVRLDVAHHVHRRQTMGQGRRLAASHRRQHAGQGRHVDAFVARQVSGDGRLLGVVVDQVQAELGAVEFLGDVAEGKAVLAIVARVVVLADGRHLEGVAVGRGHAVGIQPGTAQHAAEHRVVAQGVV